MTLDVYRGRKTTMQQQLTYLDNSRARAYYAAVGLGVGCLDIFLSRLSSLLFFPSFWETARYILKYCLKGP